MIIVLGGQKGGTGKSTLAMNLTVALTRGGAKTLLLDTDTQRSSSNWSDTRSNNGIEPAITCVQKTAKLLQVLGDMAELYEHVVVDAGGRDSVELRSALTLADRLYTPVKASQNDLWTVDAMSEVVENASALNPRLSAYLVLTMVPTNPAIRELQNARQLLVEYPAFRQCSTVIHERKAYRDVVFLGKGVVEHTDRKAADEIDAFTLEVLGSHELLKAATA
jgi:chromosome partitioning protein